MRVVTVARKPLSEGNVAGNVLKHGTGAMNINASRISYGADEGVDFDKQQVQQADGSQASVTGAFGAARVGTSINTYKPNGRWPANLILSHLDGCRVTGTRTEPGYTINRFTDGMKPFGEGAGHAYEGSEVGAQEVLVWECVPGCPVSGLDAHALELMPSKYFKNVGGSTPL